MSRFALCLAACLFAVPALADEQAAIGENDITANDINTHFLESCPAAKAYYGNKSNTDYIAGTIDTLTDTAGKLQVQLTGPPFIQVEFPNPHFASPATIPPSFNGTYWLAVEPLDVAAIYEGTGASCKLLMKPSLYTELPAP